MIPKQDILQGSDQPNKDHYVVVQSFFLKHMHTKKKRFPVQTRVGTPTCHKEHVTVKKNVQLYDPTLLKIIL